MKTNKKEISCNSVVPAILTDNKEEFQTAINTCAHFTNYIQVDIMDGEFVPSVSVGLDAIAHAQSPVASEAHLMVERPIEWIEAFKHFGSQRVLFHFEIDDDHCKIIDAIRAHGMEPGIAINPATAFDAFHFLIDKVDALLFMSVNPGFYGAQFIPEVLEKIKRVRKLYPKKIIGIDGGVKLSNLPAIIESGVSYVCVGSAIMKDNDPKRAYGQFVDVIKKSRQSL